MANILVVDNEPLILRLIQKALELDKHTTQVCENGQQAFALLNQKPSAFDIIISDESMPMMTGCELATAVNRNPKFGDIPFIIVSADHNTDKFNKLLAEKVIQYFIPKPFSIYALLAAVNTLAAAPVAAASRF